MTRLTHQHALALTMLLVLTWSTASVAQDRYFPLDQRQPTGTAARFSRISRPHRYGYAQPVRVSLPSQGHVSYYSGSPHNPVLTQSPSQAGMMVGHVYRVKISGLPEYPGVELYPTIEILDRLHPPSDRIQDFPIPIEITAEEIEIVLDNRMVTKVVYLEQPDMAAPFHKDESSLITEMSSRANLLKEADLRGRPMAILRIGGRIPDPRSPQDEFYSTSPILISTQ